METILLEASAQPHDTYKVRVHAVVCTLSPSIFYWNHCIALSFVEYVATDIFVVF